MWKLIYGICFLSYPMIYIYNRFFKHGFNIVKGRYCASLIKYKGKNLRIVGMCTLLDTDKITIGDYCSIGEGAYFHAMGGLSIGNNVIISRNVTIYTSNHNYHSKEYIPFDNTHILKPVTINNHVWIGRNVCILPGVTIGEGAIIGMSAVITKDIPPLAIVVGNNHIIGYREQYRDDIKFYGKYY